MERSRLPPQGLLGVAESLEKVLPHTRLSTFVDHWVRRLDALVSWVWLLLIGVIVANVVMRYLFAEGRIEFEEIQWHLYAIGFLLGMAGAYVNDAHIRVDVVRGRFSPVTQAWIELYGTLLLLLPFLLLVCVASVPFLTYSYGTSEVSEAPGGLPYRWFVKSFLLTGFVLLLLTAVARLTRITAFLFGWPGDREARHVSG